jgi:hypothetical protein
MHVVFCRFTLRCPLGPLQEPTVKDRSYFMQPIVSSVLGFDGGNLSRSIKLTKAKIAAAKRENDDQGDAGVVDTRAARETATAATWFGFCGVSQCGTSIGTAHIRTSNTYRSIHYVCEGCLYRNKAP